MEKTSIRHYYRVWNENLSEMVQVLPGDRFEVNDDSSGLLYQRDGTVVPFKAGHLMQCVGLVDSTGRPVFEKDLLSALKDDRIYSIRWKLGKFRIRLRDNQDSLAKPLSALKEMEVIGNSLQGIVELS